MHSHRCGQGGVGNIVAIQKGPVLFAIFSLTCCVNLPDPPSHHFPEIHLPSEHLHPLMHCREVMNASTSLQSRQCNPLGETPCPGNGYLHSPLLWTLVPACQEAGEGPDQCCPSTAVVSPCSQLLVLSPATSGPPVALGKARYWAFQIAK